MGLCGLFSVLAIGSLVADNMTAMFIADCFFLLFMQTSGVKLLSRNEGTLSVTKKPVQQTKKTIHQLDQKQVRQLLKDARALPSIGQRMKLISASLLGRPYLAHSLIGSAKEPEVFVATLDGFDCVTFVETVLALARAESVEEFLASLRKIRYERSEVTWEKRLHYATDWLQHNILGGLLTDMTSGEDTLVRTKPVSFIAGLPSHTVSFHYYPKRKLPQVSRWLADGDLIFFASTRQGLDVFHTGIVFRQGDRVILRHATRSQGRVVEQDLAEFVRLNQMPGFIIARPTER